MIQPVSGRLSHCLLTNPQLPASVRAELSRQAASLTQKNGACADTGPYLFVLRFSSDQHLQDVVNRIAFHRWYRLP